MKNSLPASLVEASLNKKLIPIIGAGVSMSLKKTDGERLFPSWKELLENAAKKLEVENKNSLANAVTASTAIDDYQYAANIVRRGLTGRLWSDFFNDQFKIKEQDISKPSLDLPKSVWKISKQVITLNYDKVLRLACPEQTIIEIDNNDNESLLKFSRFENTDYILWHMHGRIDNSNEIIFTSESYSKLYLEENKKYSAALTIFQTICREKQLIFIGCSLDDADLLKEISNQHSIFAESTGPHYALVKESDKTTIKSKLKGLPIELVTFTDFGQPLIELINNIAQSDSNAQATSLSTTTNATATSEDTKNTKNQKANVKIAILSAQPIDKNYSYENLTNEFKKLKAEITLKHLSIDELNNLEAFDYIFILSKLNRNKVVIEDGFLSTRLISLNEMVENIGDDNTKGIFIFLDHKETTDLDSNDLTELKSPMIIFPQMTKNEINSFSFKIFRKQDYSYLKNATLFNIDRFDVAELKGKSIIYKNSSKLPENVDPRTTRNYVGRVTDLENLSRKLIEIRDTGDILTIKGSGGIGKTITVKKLLVTFSERGFFTQGIHFADCEFITTIKVFEQHIAQAFNLENALNIKNAIKDNYESNNRVIVLDNFETLLHIEDCEEIKQLISFVAEYASIVITTRELIGFECEQIYELRPLTTDEAYNLFVQELNWRSEISEQDKQIIREDILETLLDNNPLAIKLVTKNIPKGKNFGDLKNELETNIFKKVSAVELETFDSVTDTNIERKKSLYGSINFSYQHLSDSEKVAFELLSMFPDGVNLEVFKRLTSERTSSRDAKDKKKLMAERLLITDSLIRALENKSLIQVDNNEIKLQSILGKFADFKFQQRSKADLARYKKNVFDYSCQFAKALIENLYQKPKLIENIFHNHQNNFIKSISNLPSIEVDSETLIEHIMHLNALFITIDNTKHLISALENQEFEFNDSEKLSYDMLTISAKYYDGDFTKAYEDLQHLLPLQKVSDLNKEKFIDKVSILCALGIYVMEGEVLTSFKLAHYIKLLDARLDQPYPEEMFQLGYFNKLLLTKTRINFFTLEAMHALGLLKQEKIEHYLQEDVYEKSHREITQTNYIKGKMGLLTKKLIQPLVVVNPYTYGLKQLMFAFVEKDLEEKLTHFKNALDGLRHIKYYYVEAMYFYAKFLQASQNKLFDEIYESGISLARKHQYRFHIHRFEQLVAEVPTEYDMSKYPLEVDSELEEYANFLIKKLET